MIKIDIVKRIADQVNIKDREALVVVDTIIDSIKETVVKEGRIEIRNFGVFQVKRRKPRKGRNPRNKKEYPIHPRNVVTFKLGKELKDFGKTAPGGDGPIPGAAERTGQTGSPGAPSHEPGQDQVQQPSFFPKDEDT